MLAVVLLLARVHILLPGEALLAAGSGVPDLRGCHEAVESLKTLSGALSLFARALRCESVVA